MGPQGDPPRERRALSHVGGPVETEGDQQAAKALAQALDVPSAPRPSPRGPREREERHEPKAEGPDRAHVHGFHSYPARMHPVTAARLVRAFAPRGGTVLDPFCGSGTVLVEALLAARHSVGTDINPLAVRLARAKTRLRDEEAVARLLGFARACQASADERRRARAGATKRYPDEDMALFDPHVLLELDSLRAAIHDVPEVDARSDLELVLSAILVKVSRRTGDTSEAIAPRRLAAGYTAKLFVRKAEELVERSGELARLLPVHSERASARADVDDAKALRSLDPRDARNVGRPRGGAIDAIITSPPYAATYDYVDHHALRLRWLGIDPRPFAAAEMGARRHYASLDPREAASAWSAEILAFCRAAARVLPPEAPLVMLMADSALGDVALRADAIVLQLAADAGFTPVARASQVRPHFHGASQAAFAGTPRAEHALLLRRAPEITERSRPRR